MTTTLDAAALSLSVQRALEGIRQSFAPADFVVEPDNEGGARVRFGPVALSKSYFQRETWVAAHLVAQLPYADVYPVFLRGDLSRADGVQLVAPMTTGHSFMGLSAVQVSRRSNRRDASIETPAMKLLKVLDWVNAQ
jgi:hypothetical protein